MKIIKVSGCHDCDPYKNYGTYCGKDNTISIHYYVFHKTLPDDCPLEELEEEKANTISSNFSYVGRSKIDGRVK